MKDIKIYYIIGTISIICSTAMTLGYFKYKNNKLQIEKNTKLELEAIKSGMVQVPVDICLNASQELRWIRPSDYLSDLPVITPDNRKK